MMKFPIREKKDKTSVTSLPRACCEMNNYDQMCSGIFIVLMNFNNKLLFLKIPVIVFSYHDMKSM